MRVSVVGCRLLVRVGGIAFIWLSGTRSTVESRSVWYAAVVAALGIVALVIAVAAIYVTLPDPFSGLPIPKMSHPAVTLGYK